MNLLMGACDAKALSSPTFCLFLLQLQDLWMRLVEIISARIARGFALQPISVRRMPMIRTIKFFAFCVWSHVEVIMCQVLRKSVHKADEESTILEEPLN